MMFGVLRKGFSSLVVDMERNRLIRTKTEFGENVLNPKALLA
jgi:hypothetical protein